MTTRVALRRNGNKLCAVLAAVLLQACLTENTHVKSIGTESSQLVRGPVLANPPPGAAVILRTTGGKLEADARWVGVCSQSERRVTAQELVVAKEVSTTTYVVSGLLTGTGLALYMWPDVDAETSLNFGTPFAIAGVLTYLIPTVQAKEKTYQQPPEMDVLPAPPAPCVISYAGHEPIVVRGRDATLQGTTDGSGHILFDSTVSGPVEVMVSGRPAQKVEWQ